MDCGKCERYIGGTGRIRDCSGTEDPSLCPENSQDEWMHRLWELKMMDEAHEEWEALQAE